MRYVPYDDLRDTPNIVVDGTGTPASAIVLSHWKGAGTPPALKDDLSTQIAFRYLDAPELHVEVDAVSNNHFDEDGLCGIYAIIDPDAARARRDLIVDVASAGDFDTCRSRDAARISFAIAAYEDEERSPLDSETLALPYPQLAAALHEETLPVFPLMLADPEKFRDLWEDEDARLSADEVRVERGAITLEERPEVDLTIVRLHDGGDWPHAMAVHNKTQRFRVAEVAGARFRLRYRYETWVDFASRPVAPRVDLAPLAGRLNEIESNGTWTFEGVDALTPQLRLSGTEESSIAGDRWLAETLSFLGT